MTSAAITALLVDDEPPARQRLRELLADHPDVVVVAEAGDVKAATIALARQRLDLVFLDIHLPDDDGFAVTELLDPTFRPAIVVTTAHSDHAIRAFDVGAVDYLLKPFARARLALTLNRVRHALDADPTQPNAHRWPIDRIPVTSGGRRVRFVEIDHIELLRAERNYVRLHAAGRQLLIRATLHELEQRLPNHQFCRISRSVIIRLDRVVEIETLPHGELHLRLTGGEQAISGRAYSPTIRARLGLGDLAF